MSNQECLNARDAAPLAARRGDQALRQDRRPRRREPRRAPRKCLRCSARTAPASRPRSRCGSAAPARRRRGAAHQPLAARRREPARCRRDDAGSRARPLLLRVRELVDLARATTLILSVDEALALTRTTDSATSGTRSSRGPEAPGAVRDRGRRPAEAAVPRRADRRPRCSGTRDDVARNPRPRRAWQLGRAHDALPRGGRGACEPGGRARERASDRVGQRRRDPLGCELHASAARARCPRTTCAAGRACSRRLATTGSSRSPRPTASRSCVDCSPLITSCTTSRCAQAALSEAFTELTKEAA